MKPCTPPGHSLDDMVEAEKNIQSNMMDAELPRGSVPFSSVQNEADMVNHPPHYQSADGLEVINVISAFTAGLYGIEAVCQGNAIKYLLRWPNKNGIEDLEKCKWYIDKLIKELKQRTVTIK